MDNRQNYRFSDYGIIQIFSNLKNSSSFNSKFLAQYDTHFSTIRHIYAKNELFRWLQSTMPDAAYTRYEAQTTLLTQSPGRFFLKDLSEMGYDRTAGQRFGHITRGSSILKLLYRFRYMRYSGASKVLNVLVDQKFSGSGYIKAGRYAHNFRKNVRYGAIVRFSVFSMYSDAILEYRRGELGAAGYGGHYPAYYDSGLKARPSAFLTRKGLIKYESSSRQRLLVVLLSAVNALRSVWFRTSEQLHRRPIVRISHYGMDYIGSRHHEMMKHGFRHLKGHFRTVLFKGTHMPGTLDVNISEPLIYNKRNLKHHSRRLCFGWYEKKLWGYDKTYKYWRYMKWVAKFYFRGLMYHRLFYMRLDVFLVYHLKVRNIRHARLLIQGGHAFIGDTVCYFPNQPVNPMTVVSISRFAKKWLNYYHYRQKAARKYRHKYGLLVFGRYFENAYIYGPMYSFAIPYGDPLDVL